MPDVCRVIEDFQLIGTSIRVGSPTPPQVLKAEPALSADMLRVLMRLRAERDQAFAVRMQELFTDMRLHGPLLAQPWQCWSASALAVGVLKSTSMDGRNRWR